MAEPGAEVGTQPTVRKNLGSNCAAPLVAPQIHVPTEGDRRTVETGKGNPLRVPFSASQRNTVDTTNLAEADRQQAETGLATARSSFKSIPQAEPNTHRHLFSENDARLLSYLDGTIPATPEQVIAEYYQQYEPTPHLAPPRVDWQHVNQMSREQQEQLVKNIRFEYISRKGHWDIEARKQTNTEMTEVEKRLGHYLEEYPQEARQAIETLVKKGYLIGVVQDYQWSSEYGPIRVMQMSHDLSAATVDALRGMGVKVKVFGNLPENQVGGLTEIGFLPNEADQQQITEMWNKIAEALPDKGWMPDLEACRKLREAIEQRISQRRELTGTFSSTAGELFGTENEDKTSKKTEQRLSLMSILQALLRVLRKKE